MQSSRLRVVAFRATAQISPLQNALQTLAPMSIGDVRTLAIAVDAELQRRERILYGTTA